MNTIHIASYPIKLDQFLKLIDVVGCGREAKVLIQNSSIRVNGCIETRRGRKLYKEFQVELKDGTAFVLA